MNTLMLPASRIIAGILQMKEKQPEECERKFIGMRRCTVNNRSGQQHKMSRSINVSDRLA